ncbi:S-methyl-5-thioribose-1-phosphate isomerase [Micromonospora echinospora]
MLGEYPGPDSISWDGDGVLAIDQRRLPHECHQLRLTTVEQIIDAVRTLAIRGAPAIGLAGAFGVAISARSGHGAAEVHDDAQRLIGARPTAVNLAWGVQRALARLTDGPAAVLDEALTMLAEDVRTNTTAATRAADLVESLCPADRPLRLLTHCNTGRLATAAVGTALGAVLELFRRGRVAEVLVNETRPLLQGARLTMWELHEAGVPCRLQVDSAAATAMAQGLVDCVLVGADRIARNGDVANKVGTYAVALAAAAHEVPMIVVAPESTWDRTLPDGAGIVVEHRDPGEVVSLAGAGVAPQGSGVHNPAFDVTPARLITALVSEQRVVRPALPADLISYSRRCYERGWMPGTSGNLSARTGGKAFITASGRNKGELTSGDIIGVRAATGAVTGDARLPPSAETCIHAAVYRTTAATAVIHVHSPYATAIAHLYGRDTEPVMLPLSRFELLKGLGLADPSTAAIPVFPNWDDVPRIADAVEEHLTAHPSALPGLLIANHGVTVWGRDLSQALNRLECLESIFQIMCITARPELRRRDLERTAP